MENIMDVLKALSDETRLRILNLLKEGELCVCHITDILDITQTKASRHLKHLKNADLVKDRQQAQWVHYSLAIEDDKLLDELLIRARTMEPFSSDLVKLKDHRSGFVTMDDMCPSKDAVNGPDNKKG